LLEPLSERLSQYMSLLSMRQQLVSSNIANADTPGYKTKDIDFENEFQNVMNGLEPVAGEVRGLTLKNDGNNVDLDREARLLAENAMRFSIAGNMLKDQLRQLKMAIEGGGASS
jgi:flagellar basal-body rod protein FlgB